MERFKRFRFSVLAVPLQKGFAVFQYSLTGKEGSGSGFGSWKTVPAVPVPLSVSGKTVPTVPVSGSGSVPVPPCKNGGHIGKISVVDMVFLVFYIGFSYLPPGWKVFL